MAKFREKKFGSYREALEDLAQEYFKQAVGIVRPIYPRVLIYMLPKEKQTKSGLWLPDHSGVAKQMKPVAEGIVIRLWGDCHYVRVTENGEESIYKIVPEVAVGDHIIYPHYAGYPPSEPYAKEFCLVPEREIIGKLEGEVDSSYKEIIDVVSPILRKWQRLEYR